MLRETTLGRIPGIRKLLSAMMLLNQRITLFTVALSASRESLPGVLGNRGSWPFTFREQGNTDFLTIRKILINVSEEKRPFDGKILHFLSIFGHWRRIIYLVLWRRAGDEFGTLGYLGEFLSGFPPPEELSKSEFRGTPKFIFEGQGNNCKFL